MILFAPTVRRLVTLSAVLLLGAAPVAQAADHGETSHHHRTSPPHVQAGRAGSFVKDYKLDDEVGRRATGNPLHTSRVIVTLVPGAVIPPQFKKFVLGDKLDIINGHVLELPNRVLAQLAAHPAVFRVHEDRDTRTHNYRTAWTVGATTVIQAMGLTGRGVGVAVIDSGISTYHDDLTVGASATLYPYGNQRVAKFVDFVNGRALPYDDNGHGSHVAGTILGNGAASSGQKAGMAPGAALVSLKVLDQDGQGKISNILAALNWVALNATTYKIRVVNLSVGAAVKESYLTDPLTLATKVLTDRGIVVVAAAGNLGKNAAGHAQYGGITAPGNAPWVLTVGASSTQGTLTRADDVMATYSSRGPTFLDWTAKPDLVAPGTGTMSLAVPGSTFFTTKAPYLIPGTNGALAYLALSGTSMAAPVVSGTVALMLQANPALTPNLVKGILQYTAQTYPGYNVLTQGAGFLNTLGAVRLAAFYKTARRGDRVPTQKIWSRHIIWGNHLMKGGILVPSKNAWGTGVVWGSAKTLGTDGDNIIWGTAGDGDNIIWGTSDGDNIIWGTATFDNIIWGTAALTNILWGTSLDFSNNIIWGTSLDGDNIIWGTECGGADCDKVVWGTADLDNIIWGTANDGDNIIWGTSMDANIVWGTAAGGEDVTWGSSASDAVTFPDDATVLLPSLLDEFGDVLPVVDVIPVGGL
jgi:serine protease AprX